MYESTKEDTMYHNLEFANLMLATEEHHDGIMTVSNEVNTMLNMIDVGVESVDFHMTRIANDSHTESVSKEHMSLAMDSLLYTCKLLGGDPSELLVSKEDISLQLSIESDVSFLERIVNAIRATYHRVIDSVKDISLKIYYTALQLEKATTSLIFHTHNLKNDTPVEKLSYEDKSHINRKFGALLATNSGHENNMHVLLGMITEAEKTVITPKTTYNMTQELRKDIYSTKLEINEILKKYFDNHTQAGFNSKLNMTFHAKLPTGEQADIDRKNISVVEFSGNKCAGVILNSETLEYTTLTAQGVMTSEDTLDKTDLLKLLGILERLNSHFNHFKDIVDKDLHIMTQFLDNLRYKISFMDSNNEDALYTSNIRVVNHITKTVPRIANGNVMNYYTFMRNLLWLAKLNYNKIYASEQTQN